MATFDGYSAYIHSSGIQKEINNELYALFTVYAIKETEGLSSARGTASTPKNKRVKAWWTCSIDPDNRDCAFYAGNTMSTGLELESRSVSYADFGVRPVIQLDLKKAEYMVKPHFKMK